MEYLTVRQAAEAILRGERLIDSLGQRTSLILDDGNLNDCSRAMIGPKTITIGGMEVPEPLRTAPPLGVRYFLPLPEGETLSYPRIWENTVLCKRSLKLGLVHLTKEAAITHAKALIKVSGGEV
jgi:hypothetical protein